MRPLLVLALAGACLAAPPEVSKVEPPGWWAGHSINPVRLLVRGRNLHGARAEADRPGIRPGTVHASDSGTYAFIDLSISPRAAAGSYAIRVTTPEGTATAPFEILQRLPRAGRFQGFSPDDVMYLIMPDRFSNGDPSNDDPPVSKGLFDRSKPRYYHGGDLQGIIDRLPYLRDLGVTALWLNPVYDNNNRLNERETYGGQAITDYHGYGAVDFYAVDEHFGNVAKFREFVDKAHAAGIKVIQDQVANHTGPYHPWVADAPTPTWYYGSERRHPANTWQTWTLADPRSTPGMQRDTLQGWFINILPDLNQDDRDCARYLIQNTLWWIGVSGIDGIRQDTLPYVHRRFWRDWMAAIKREYPRFTVVGEVFDGDPALVSFFQGGRAGFDGIDSGIDTVFDFPGFFPLRRAFAEGKSVRELAAIIGHDRLYPNPDALVTFLGLHDVERFMNIRGATVDGLKLAFTFLLTARGTPLVYYGDEIAMPGGNDPDNRRDFPAAAFDDSGATPEQQSVRAHVRRLARLRAKMEPFRRGKMVNLYADDNVYAYGRTGGGTAVVVLNNAAKAVAVAFEVPGLERGSLTDALDIAPPVQVENGIVSVTMPARSGAIYIPR